MLQNNFQNIKMWNGNIFFEKGVKDLDEIHFMFWFIFKVQWMFELLSNGIFI